MYLCMRLLSIAIDILRIETDTKFKTVGNEEIGGRDQREQLADSHTHTHIYFCKTISALTKRSEMKRKKHTHENSKKSFYKLTAEMVKIRRKLDN